MQNVRVLCLALLILLSSGARAFSRWRVNHFRAGSDIRMSASDNVAEVLQDPKDMKVRELKEELTSRGVSTRSLLEKSELVAALEEARLQPMPKASEPVAASTTGEPTSEVPVDESESSSVSPDAEAKARARANAMRARELRTELHKRNVPWQSCREKSELVELLVPHLISEGDFSLSGALRPGSVGELNEEEVEAEMGKASTPLILDCYADWCGPCKMMAPELEAAAAELGSRVRVAKMDVDKNQEKSAELQIEAMPTILFVSADGKEVHRLQGARMKQGLLEVTEHLFFGGPSPSLGL